MQEDQLESQQTIESVIRPVIKVINKIFVKHNASKTIEQQSQQKSGVKFENAKSSSQQLKNKQEQLKVYIESVEEAMLVDYQKMYQNEHTQSQIYNPLKYYSIKNYRYHLHKFAAIIWLLTTIDLQSFYLLYKEYYYFERQVANIFSIWEKLSDKSQQIKQSSQLSKKRTTKKKFKKRYDELTLIRIKAQRDLFIKIFESLKVFYQKQQHQLIKNYHHFFAVEQKYNPQLQLINAIECNENFFNYVLKLLVDLSLMKIRHVFLENVIDLEDFQKEALIPFVEQVMERSFLNQNIPSQKNQYSRSNKSGVLQRKNQRSKSRSSKSGTKQSSAKDIDMVAFISQFDQLRAKYIELQSEHAQLQQSHNSLKDSYNQVKSEVQLLKYQRGKLIRSLQIRNQNVTCQDIAQRYHSDIQQLSSQIQKLCQQIDEKNQLLTLRACQINNLAGNIQQFNQSQLKKSINSRNRKSSDSLNGNQDLTQLRNWREDYERLKKIEELEQERLDQIRSLKQVIRTLTEDQMAKDRRITELEMIEEKFNRLKKKHTQFHQTVTKFSERQKN